MLSSYDHCVTLCKENAPLILPVLLAALSIGLCWFIEKYQNGKSQWKLSTWRLSGGCLHRWTCLELLSPMPLLLSHEQVHPRNHTNVFVKCRAVGSGSRHGCVTLHRNDAPGWLGLHLLPGISLLGDSTALAKVVVLCPGPQVYPVVLPSLRKELLWTARLHAAPTETKLCPWASPLSLHYRAYAQSVNKLFHQGNCFLCHLIFYSLSFQRPEKLGIEQTGKNN